MNDRRDLRGLVSVLAEGLRHPNARRREVGLNILESIDESELADDAVQPFDHLRLKAEQVEQVEQLEHLAREVTQRIGRRPGRVSDAGVAFLLGQYLLARFGAPISLLIEPWYRCTHRARESSPDPAVFFGAPPGAFVRIERRSHRVNFGWKLAVGEGVRARTKRLHDPARVGRGRALVEAATQRNGVDRFVQTHADADAQATPDLAQLLGAGDVCFRHVLDRTRVFSVTRTRGDAAVTTNITPRNSPRRGPRRRLTVLLIES